VDVPYDPAITPVVASATVAGPVPDTEIEEISPPKLLNTGSSPLIPKRTCPSVPGVSDDKAPIPDPIIKPWSVNDVDPVPPKGTATGVPCQTPEVILPLFTTIPFMVFIDDGAVMAPVVVNEPFIVTLLPSKDIKSASVTRPISPLLLSKPHQ